VILLAGWEQRGRPKEYIGDAFLAATVLLCGGIGVMSRTNDAAEYYVAGRRVPALYNGMATGADWMSAASFIGMAGTLYLTGYGGLAFILGWTGGYCLVAFLLAPYLRRFGQFTIPDFLGARYGGEWPRLLGVAATVLVSFVYVVVQVYGVGLVTSHLTGFSFEIGIFVGLGGVLVCWFLGGMRAVTWTQVAQYIVLPSPPGLLLKPPGIRIAFFDVEGVLPEGGLYLSEHGESLKRFNTLDGHGLKLLQKAGITPVVITGRDSAPLRLRMKALGITYARFGTEDKRPAAEAFLQELGASWSQAAAMGDDWPDLPVMQRVAFACAPANGHAQAKALAHHVTAERGGEIGRAHV